jgi:hypothetical protein
MNFFRRRVSRELPPVPKNARVHSGDVPEHLDPEGVAESLADEQLGEDMTKYENMPSKEPMGVKGSRGKGNAPDGNEKRIDDSNRDMKRFVTRKNARRKFQSSGKVVRGAHPDTKPKARGNIGREVGDKYADMTVQPDAE